MNLFTITSKQKKCKQETVCAFNLAKKVLDDRERKEIIHL